MINQYAQISLASVSGGFSDKTGEHDVSRDERSPTDLSVDIENIMEELLHHNETISSPYAVSEELEPFFTEGETMLFEAARTGDVEVLQRYIDSGASLEVQDSGVGFTPLHQACRCGQVCCAYCPIYLFWRTHCDDPYYMMCPTCVANLLFMSLRLHISWKLSNCW
jgi:hypothetical protein